MSRNEHGHTPAQQWEIDSHRGARQDFKHSAKMYADAGEMEKSRKMSRMAARCTLAVVGMLAAFAISNSIWNG